MTLFSRTEYMDRITRTKAAMADRGMDLLVVCDPANMNYLTGYDGWSFYVPQAVLMIDDQEEPVWIGRNMDRNGAMHTAFITEQNMIGYPDDYVQSPVKHPMNFMGDVIRQRGWDKKTIGVETDAYYYTARSDAELKKTLGKDTLADANLLVNWVRIIKSDAEIALMQQAGKIAEKVTDEPYQADQAVNLELAGCRHRYHCPIARTAFLSPNPPQKLSDLADITVEGLNLTLDTITPGMTGEIIDLRRHFHMHPELGFQEFETANKIETYLQHLGYDTIRMVKTGVVANLDSGRPGPVLMLRADMDALPITETSQKSYSSRNDGVMHACGHDAHMAMLLVAARILRENKSTINGKIKFVFQPNEEIAGAIHMIADGVLENPTVDAVMGIHIFIVVVTFAGLSYAARNGRHIRMSAIYDVMPVKIRKALMIGMTSITSAFMFFLSFYAYNYIVEVYQSGRILPALGLPVFYIYLWVPVGFVVTGLQYAFTVVKNLTQSDIYLSTSVKDGYADTDNDVEV